MMSFCIYTHAFDCSDDNRQWQTPEEALLLAIDRLDGAEVQRVIIAGVDVNVYIQGVTPLSLSISKVVLGYDVIDIIQQLLLAGASFRSVITLDTGKRCTIGEYAVELCDNYIKAVELSRLNLCNNGLSNHGQQALATDRELQLCIDRTKKILKLIERYSKQ